MKKQKWEKECDESLPVVTLDSSLANNQTTKQIRKLATMIRKGYKIRFSDSSGTRIHIYLKK